MTLHDFSVTRARHSGTFADRLQTVRFTGSDGSSVRIVELWALGVRLQLILG